MLSKKPNRPDPLQPSGYKTEEQLKEEAKERARLMELAKAKRKPPSKVEKKAENFWYHYKWAVLGGGFAVVLLAFLIRDLAFRTDPDYTVILCGDSYVSMEDQDALAEALAAYGVDRNGDGQVVVAVDSIRLSASFLADIFEEEPELPAAGGEDGDPGVSINISGNDDYAMVMKLTTVLAAGTDPLYILDDGAYRYLHRSAEEDADARYSVFIPLDGEVAGAEGDRLPVERTALSGADGIDFLGGYGFYLRSRVSGDKDGAYLEACLQLLREVAG